MMSYISYYDFFPERRCRCWEHRCPCCGGYKPAPAPKPIVIEREIIKIVPAKRWR